jgi:hypothetical protein
MRRSHVTYCYRSLSVRTHKLPDTALATGINRVMNANVPVAIGVGDKLVGTFRAQLG